jgi:hypothetical protein
MTIQIKDAIADIAKNVISTGFYEKIKITGGSKNSTVEAIDKDKQIILKATTLKPVDGWSGEFGLANLGLLNSIVNDSEFAHKDSRMELVFQEREGVDVPTELHYTNKSNSFICYRFLGKNTVPEQPKYMEPSWDVKIKPNKSNIQQFNWAAGSLGSYEQYFIPKTVDGNLKFFIGDEGAATQRGGVVFATSVTGEFDSSHKWPIALVSSLLKLVDGADAEMSFSVKGAIQLSLNTGITTYKYVLPAKLR